MSVTIPWGSSSAKESVKISFCLREFVRVDGGIRGLHQTVSQYGIVNSSQIDPLLEPFDLSNIRKIIEEMSGQFINIKRLTKKISVENKKNSQVQTIAILAYSVLFGASFAYLLKKKAGSLFYTLFMGTILGIYKLSTSTTQKIEGRKMKLLQEKAKAEVSILKKYNKVVSFYTDKSGKFPKLIQAFYNLSVLQNLTDYQKGMVRETFFYLAYFFEVCVDPIREKNVPTNIRQEIGQEYEKWRDLGIFKEFPIIERATHVTSNR